MIERLVKMDAVLVFPKRNCDVGTVEEQNKRWQNYCTKNSQNRSCTKCPLFPLRIKGANCTIVYLNLPYEEVIP